MSNYKGSMYIIMGIISVTCIVGMKKLYKNYIKNKRKHEIEFIDSDLSTISSNESINSEYQEDALSTVSNNELFSNYDENISESIDNSIHESLYESVDEN